MSEEKQPVDEKEKETPPVDGTGKNQEGQGESEAQKQRREKLKALLESDELLDDAVEAEILKLENAKLKKEDTIRKLRDEKREIKNAPIENSEEPPKPTDADAIAKRVKAEILQESQAKNIELAKAQFYKTEYGKKFDPINDPDGRNWNKLKEFLILKPGDVSSQDILKRYRAAAFAALEDTNGDVALEQDRKNREKAEEALNDIGSGGTTGANTRVPGVNSDKIVLTEEQKKRCQQTGISEEKYIESLKKLKKTPSKEFIPIKFS